MVGNSYGEMSVEEFLKVYKLGRQSEKLANVNNLLVNGIGIGFMWANTELKHDGRKQLYCQPRLKAIKPEKMVNLLRNYIEENPQYLRLPLGMVMLQTNIKVYPCKEY